MSKPDVPVLPEGVEDAIVNALAHAMCDTGAEPSTSLAQRSADRLRRAIAAVIKRAEADGIEACGNYEYLTDAIDAAEAMRAEADALEKGDADA